MTQSTAIVEAANNIHASIVVTILNLFHRVTLEKKNWYMNNKRNQALMYSEWA